MLFKSSATLERSLQDALQNLSQLANSGYCVGFHIRQGVPSTRYSTLNTSWLHHYEQRGYLLRDPGLAWASAVNGAVRWSDPILVDTYGVYAEARRFGLRYGMVASYGPPASLSVAVLVRNDREFLDTEMATAFDRLQRLHSLAVLPGNLSQAQKEALSVISSGQRYAAAAAHLGISESALKARLYSARQRLNARTTPEAVRCAKDYGLI
ncbi:autoinducer binding domain-containing protein [Falsirhodobacter sp. 20TX0035]|uniref:autoinducer binding domain-containing protein n=1 Tax=Falsirhodobacter sp. 20TX0035 TaxID=3022019 RepID=UPI00232C8623|nr:autoinducer binding domain-containing protein [Falsirhodobacter sp. 20TX0035]MDB6454656.1 autoinducer binding domain-containing protein [Falsirhodobacter sp. 20TX0035]